MTRKTLSIGNVRLDGDTQPRAELDRDAVQEYSESYASGKTLPPPVVFFDGVDHWLADGFHRFFAANRVDLDKLKCEVRTGTLDDARWYACSANQGHGLRRSNADKRKAVLAALKHPKGAKMSDGQIAEHVGVSDRMVNKYRGELTPKDSESTTRTGRDGRTTNTANIGKKAKAEQTPEPEPDESEADDEDDEEPTEPQPEQPRYFTRFVALWEEADEVGRAAIRAFVLDN